MPQRSKPRALYGPTTTPLSRQTSRPYLVEDADGRPVMRFATHDEAVEWLRERGYSITGQEKT